MARARTKPKDKAELLWEEYRAAQLTPEQQAEAHEVVLRKVEQARRAGVYEQVIEIAGTVKWESDWQQLRLESW